MKIVEVENLTNEDFEFRCDGVPYVVKARSSEHLEESVAEHGKRKSIFQFDPMTGDSKYQLSIVGVDDEGPLGDNEHKVVELLDREAMGDTHAKPLEFGNPDFPVRKSKPKPRLSDVVVGTSPNAD